MLTLTFCLHCCSLSSAFSPEEPVLLKKDSSSMYWARLMLIARFCN